MSITPPPGYGISAWTFQATGSARTAVNTYGFKNNAGATALGARTAISTAFVGGSRLYDDQWYNTEWTLVQQYVLLNNAGVLTSDTGLYGIPGLGGWDSPGPGTSAVVRKTTALAGRAYRGRIALPAGFLDEADISAAGYMSSGFVATLQAVITASLNAMSAANLPMYIIHGPNNLGVTPAPTLVSAMTMDTLTGSQRRRLRR